MPPAKKSKPAAKNAVAPVVSKAKKPAPAKAKAPRAVAKKKAAPVKAKAESVPKRPVAHSARTLKSRPNQKLEPVPNGIAEARAENASVIEVAKGYFRALGRLGMRLVGIIREKT
jgi:hypothetical protein